MYTIFCQTLATNWTKGKYRMNEVLFITKLSNLQLQRIWYFISWNKDNKIFCFYQRFAYTVVCMWLRTNVNLQSLSYWIIKYSNSLYYCVLYNFILNWFCALVVSWVELCFLGSEWADCNEFCMTAYNVMAVINFINGQFSDMCFEASEPNILCFMLIWQKLLFFMCSFLKFFV